MPIYRRAFNAGDTIEFLYTKKVFRGTILEWLMNEQRYRVQNECGQIHWIRPKAVLKKVTLFEMTLD